MKIPKDFVPDTDLKENLEALLEDKDAKFFYVSPNQKKSYKDKDLLINDLYELLDSFFNKKFHGFTRDTPEHIEEVSKKHNPILSLGLMGGSHLGNYGVYGPYFSPESNAWVVLALLSEGSEMKNSKAKKVAKFMKKRLRIRTKPARIVQGTPFSGRYIRKPWAPNEATYAQENGISGIAMLNTGNNFAAFDTKRYVLNVLRKKGMFFSMNWDSCSSDSILRAYTALFLKGCHKKNLGRIINEYINEGKCSFFDEALLNLSLGRDTEAKKILEEYKSERDERIKNHNYFAEHDSTMALVEGILGGGYECLNHALDIIFKEPDDEYPHLNYPIKVISQTILSLRPEKAKKLLFLD